MQIQALVTCHNRVDKTLTILREIHTQELPEGVTLRITLVDDGSSDGTSEKVRKSFSDIEIVEGTGELFWAGGMRYGWEHSVKSKQFDALLVFNDDISLFKESLKHLIKNYLDARNKFGEKCAVSGAFCTRVDYTKVTYGGLKRSSKWHPLRFKKVTPNGFLQSLDTINMNFVLISREALDDVGFLASYFRHSGADYEFGLRLQRNGGKLLLSEKVLGICERNLKKGTSSEDGIGYWKRLERLTSIKEQPFKQRFLYYKSYAGVFWFFLFLLPYLRYLVTIVKKERLLKKSKL